MKPDNEGVYVKTVHAGKWIIIQNVVQKVLSFGAFLILARLLAPDDYGVIAIIFIITGVLEAVSAPGFEKALLQRRDEAEEYLDTIWTFHLVRSFALAALVYVCAPFLADFFHIPNQVMLLRYAALLVVLPSLANIRQFYFFRDLQFKQIFVRDLLGQLAYILCALVWIYAVGASVMALFVGHVARHSISALATYWLYPSLPRLSFSFRRLKNLIGYGKWVTAQNTVSYFLGIVDSAYIGRLLDTERLGYYTKARDLSYVFVSPFFNIINRVGLPAYAQLQDKMPKIQEGFVRTFNIVVAFLIPISLVIAAEGGFLVSLLLGKKWLGIVVPLKILSAATILSSLVAITKPIFDALGRPHITFKATTLQLGAALLLAYGGARFLGLSGVAWGMLGSWVVVLVYVIIAARPILRLGFDAFKEQLAASGGALFATIIVVCPLYIFGVRETLPSWVVIVMLVLSGGWYALCLRALSLKYSQGPWQTLMSVIYEVLRKK